METPRKTYYRTSTEPRLLSAEINEIDLSQDQPKQGGTNKHNRGITGQKWALQKLFTSKLVRPRGDGKFQKPEPKTIYKHHQIQSGRY